MRSSGWRRCSGLVSTASPYASRAEGFLDGAQVLALIESDPDAPYAVAVTIAVDEDGRVAALAADRAEVVPGPSVQELAEALATECQALVVFEEVVAEDVGDTLPEGDDDPFAFELDLESARLPERAVVLTPASQRDLEELATEAQTTLYALDPEADAAPGRVVLLQDGPALTALEWRTDHMPVVLLERGHSFPSVTVIAQPGDAHLFSWDVALTSVPSGAPSVTEPFVSDVLGTGALVRALSAVRPHADAAALSEALHQPGERGLPALAEALALPEQVVRFLRGELDAADLPGTAELDPLTVAEQVRRAMDDVADEARAQVEHMRETADEYRAQARAQMRHVTDEAREQARTNVQHVRRHASDASEAMHTFADPDEHPTLAWTTPLVGAAQAIGAILALRRALAHAQNGGSGNRWWGLAAGVLGTAAGANLALTALPWIRRWRAQRP